MAEQIAQDAAAQGGGPLGIQRRVDDMSAHDHRHARVDGRAERLEVGPQFVVRPRVDGDAVVTVGLGAAVPGEVLGAGGDAPPLGGGDPGPQVAGGQRRFGAEGPGAHDRVARMVLEVGDRRVGDRDAERGQMPGQGVGAAAGQRGIVGHSERERSGHLGSPGTHQVPDPPALVVDPHEQVGPQGPQLRGEPPHLLRVPHVAGEQDDAAEPSVDEPLQLVRNPGRPVEPRDETAVSGLVEIDGQTGGTCGRMRGGGHSAHLLARSSISQQGDGSFIQYEDGDGPGRNVPEVPSSPTPTPPTPASLVGHRRRTGGCPW